MQLTNFMAAVEQLGKDNSERAARFGMTGRRLEQWKYKGVPRLLSVLVTSPDLLQALLVDAQELAKKTSQSA